MSNQITVQASDGSTITYKDEIKAQGGMKDVYFSIDNKLAIAFFREPVNSEGRSRLLEITDTYRERMFAQEGGDYLRNLYCWPTAIVEHNGRTGVVVPFYRDCFFFQHGFKNKKANAILGKEKKGKWFTTLKHRARFLDREELGDWMSYLKLSIMVARAVRRMHMAGLCHSDLGYNNCLIDPVTGQACLIDIDGLVVPGKHPPTVIGTPDFIAPEVVATSGLEAGDPNRILPSRTTDLHALAVMIYMYLFYRHPLRGSKIHDRDDSERDEELLMGSGALFIEDRKDTSNRIVPDGDTSWLEEYELPWLDTNTLPCTAAGPYLSELFYRAFEEGLHTPQKRPSADEWEAALVKTVDLLQPCANKECSQKWYPFDNSRAPRCPFCGTAFHGKLPVLNLYSAVTPGKFLPDNHRIMVYNGQSLFRWHENRTIFPNERLRAEESKRVGYFVFHQGEWYLVNERLSGMMDVKTKKRIAPGESIILAEGAQILLSGESGGRLIAVQMVNC